MFEFETVAQSIAALDVAGLTICDYSTTPDAVLPTMLPIMFPDPGVGLIDFEFVRETVGLGANAAKDVNYSMSYVLLYAPVNSVMSRAQIKLKMVRLFKELLTKITENDTLAGCDNIDPQSMTDAGMVLSDGASNSYIGCHLTFRVLEYL